MPRFVFDRFHIVPALTKTVDTVRKQEHHGFLRNGENSPLTVTLRSRLKLAKNAATMLKRHLAGVLRSVKHSTANGVAEGLNGNIMSIKARPATSATRRTSQQFSISTAEALIYACRQSRRIRNPNDKLCATQLRDADSTPHVCSVNEKTC